MRLHLPRSPFVMQAQSLGLFVAFSAGLLSFLSPCVLPLVPSYATFITGMSLDELQAQETSRTRRTVFVHGLLFVLGFTLVFLALGASTTFIGALLKFASRWVQAVGGVLLILFGLYLVGVLRLPGAGREWRMHLAEKPVGYLGTLLVGITFGAGWTPCIGPVLGGILTMAAARGTMGQGIGLLAVYSAGLAVPFLLSTLLIDWFLTGFRRFRRALPWINRISGAMLLVLGVLMVTGSFTTLSAIMARWTPAWLSARL
ncbi:MAG TPA: cytochrome c biogenesis protein CcdA [Longimicrobiaceae bacterium]